MKEKLFIIVSKKKIWKEENNLQDIIQMIITNVLTALYQPFGFSIILAVLFMFFYLFVVEHGWKSACRKWVKMFKSKSEFRRVFLLAFYTAFNFISHIVESEFMDESTGECYGRMESV